MFGLAVGETVHDLQKSALPSVGAPSQLALPPAPPSARGAELDELHAEETTRSAPHSEEKRALEDGFMA